MKRRGWVLAVGAVAMGSAVQAQSSVIAFSSDRASTDFDILIMKETGEAQTQVTSESAAARRPSISTDGTKIVYDDHDDLLMINHDGTGPFTLTAGLSMCDDYNFENDPAKPVVQGCEDADAGSVVNQDGDFLIVFTRETEQVSPGPTFGSRVANLYLGRVDVSAGQLVDLEQLTFSEDCADPIHYQAAWCGASHIVWSREIGSLCSFSPDYDWEICTMPVDASGPLGAPTCYFLNDETANQYPSCTAGGTKIAFAQSDGMDEERPHDICTMNFDGSNLVCFTNEEDDPDNLYYDDTRPSWSPSGTVIAFASDRVSGGGSDYEIWVMNADGSGLTQRTTNSVPDDDPDYGAGRLRP